MTNHEQDRTKPEHGQPAEAQGRWIPAETWPKVGGTYLVRIREDNEVHFGYLIYFDMEPRYSNHTPNGPAWSVTGVWPDPKHTVIEWAEIPAREAPVALSTRELQEKK